MSLDSPESYLARPALVVATLGKAPRRWLSRIRRKVFLWAPRLSRITGYLGAPRMLQSRDYHEMRAAHAHDWLRRRPEAWRQYHTRTPKDHQTWPEVPVQILASELRQHPHWVIGDFGCGEAALALSLPEWTVHSFDHVAANERVTACNMCRVPLDDEVLDVAVFCLSFWGSLDDIHSYLVEAHRTLKPSGNLRIADGRSRWEGDRRNALLDTIRAAGFNDVEVIRESCPFLYINATKGTDGRSGPIVDEVSRRSRAG